MAEPAEPEANRAKLSGDLHAVLPVCNGGFDNVIGFVRATRVLEQVLATGTFDLASRGTVRP